MNLERPDDKKKPKHIEKLSFVIVARFRKKNELFYEELWQILRELSDRKDLCRRYIVSSLTKSSNDPRELYLGLLYPTEDYKVYGYVTNSKIKFVVVVESANTALRDNEIRTMFRRLHVAYTDMFCNPFYNPGENITSRKFEDTVVKMMKQD